MKEYQNIQLEEKDYEAILALEALLHEPIPSVSQPTSFGFSSEQGRIIALYIAKKKIVKIVDNIGQLSALKRINLSENLLKELPLSFQNLLMLEDLDLCGNKFAAFPESILTLNNLKMLFIGENGLTKIPEEITQLTNLELIDLSNNQIQILSFNFGNFPKLRVLDLAYNQLQKLPPSFRDLNNIEELLLNNNSLRSFEFFPRLEPTRDIDQIYLSANPYRSLTGISMDNLPRILDKYFIGLLDEYPISPTGKRLIERTVNAETNEFVNQHLKELFLYYQLSPAEIAEKYITTHKITEDEYDRLFHEMDNEIQALLLKTLNPTDPLFSTIKNNPIL